MFLLGSVISKTPIEFVALVGWGNGNGYLNVQNIGGVKWGMEDFV
jgi:hypothetical protein